MLANFLKNSLGGQFLGRYGITDTKTPLAGGNLDADRPRNMTGVRQSAATTVNNGVAFVEDQIKATVAPFLTSYEWALKGGDKLANFLGLEKKGVITSVLGGIGGFLAGAVAGGVKALFHEGHSVVDAAQCGAGVVETAWDGVKALFGGR